MSRFLIPSVLVLLLNEAVIYSAELYSQCEPDDEKFIEVLEDRLEELEHPIRELQKRVSKWDNENTTLEPKPSTCEISRKYPRNCADIPKADRRSGVHLIHANFYGEKPFPVYCDQETDGGNWVVIQRRIHGHIEFFRDWNAYKEGFGNLKDEFFIGLDKLYALTADEVQELLVVLTDWFGVTKYAKYDLFAIGDEEELYTLKVLGNYVGNAGDALSYHSGQRFVTRDRDENFCAAGFKGGWWYKNCYNANLNGRYLSREGSFDGISWVPWHGYNCSLKAVAMMIRPSIFANN